MYTIYKHTKRTILTLYGISWFWFGFIFICKCKENCNFGGYRMFMVFHVIINQTSLCLSCMFYNF